MDVKQSLALNFGNCRHLMPGLNTGRIVAREKARIRKGIVMSGRRPLIKGNFGVLRWSWVRACLRPVDAG
jgi:hypothetical protein